MLCMLALISVKPTESAAQEKDWAKFGRYEKANKALAVLKRIPAAVFIGDSITDGWDDADAAFFSGNNFCCRGIGGQTTAHMLVRFRRDALDLQPRYAVILAGTNDIAGNIGRIDAENILGNIVSMCELARAHGIKPILCSVLPVARYPWRPEVEPAEPIQKLNGLLRAYAKSQCIPYVDYFTEMKDDGEGLKPEYTTDGVHLTPAGYEAMEKLFLETYERLDDRP